MAYITGVIPSQNPTIKNGTVLVRSTQQGTGIGNYQKINTYANNYPTSMNQIATKYDNKFDDVGYYVNASGY